MSSGISLAKWPRGHEVVDGTPEVLVVWDSIVPPCDNCNNTGWVSGGATLDESWTGTCPACAHLQIARSCIAEVIAAEVELRSASEELETFFHRVGRVDLLPEPSPLVTRLQEAGQRRYRALNSLAWVKPSQAIHNLPQIETGD